MELSDKQISIMIKTIWNNRRHIADDEDVLDQAITVVIKQAKRIMLEAEQVKNEGSNKYKKRKLNAGF